MIYMKGVPDMPRCGFSSLAVRVLTQYGNFQVSELNEYISRHDNLFVSEGKMHVCVQLQLDA